MLESAGYSSSSNMQAEPLARTSPAELGTLALAIYDSFEKTPKGDS